MKKTILSLLSAAILLVCAPTQIWANNGTALQEMYSINAAPTIAGISHSNVTATSANANVDFKASTGSTLVKVKYGYNLSSSLTQSVSSNSFYTTTTRINIPNLQPNTTYSYQFEITDVNGLVVSSATKSFRTQLAAPIVSNFSVTGITDNSATINFSFNRQNSYCNVYIDYGRSNLNLYNSVFVGAYSSGSVFNLSKTLTGLNYNTTYYYQIRVEYSPEGTCYMQALYPATIANSFTTLDATSSPEFPWRQRVGAPKDSDNISIYPNPATNVLNVVSEHGIEEIEIINMQGKLLLSGTSSPMNISYLPTGTYFVRVTDVKGKVSTHKFNKQ